MLLVLLLLLLGFLTFGAAGSDVSGSSSAREGPTSLTVAVWPRGKNGPVSRWTLTCGPRPGGTHPNPRPACRALLENPSALAPLPPTTACTEIYGGPQMAELRGVVDGRTVRLSYDRADGCGIDRWNALHPVFHIRI